MKIRQILLGVVVLPALFSMTLAGEKSALWIAKDAAAVQMLQTDPSDGHYTNIEDLAEFAGSWLVSDCGFDLYIDYNRDCVVDANDLTRLSKNWLAVDIIQAMRLANDYFMAKWPDPGANIVSPDKTRPSNIWTRATYYEGLMAMYGIDPQQRYYDYAVAWGQAHNWTLAWGTKAPYDPDNQCCGQTYIDLYKIDPQPERIATIKTYIDNMVADTKIDNWWWIDGLQMAMPVFARLGAVYNDNVYYEKMYAIYNHTKTARDTSGLYNPVDHLWWRDKNFNPPYVEPNGEDCYWSRGNGWVFAAMVRVLDVMPAGTPHRDEYLQVFLDMAQALAQVQRSDGFWNVSLHDPTHFPGPETSGTAFFTYGMAWGINHGLLDRQTYEPIVMKAWTAMARDALHSDGFIGYVQGTGEKPADSQPVTYDSIPNFEDFTLGALLLAGTEVYKMNQ